MLNDVFINSIVLCKEVERRPDGSGVGFRDVITYLTPEYTVPEWKINVKCQLCVNAIVRDPAAVHKITLGLKEPDGTESLLGDFTLAIPVHNVSANQVPIELIFRQEGMHYLFLFLGQEALRSYGIPVVTDTVLFD